MRPFGISAFVRCKNEEEYIVASLTSIYRVFDEIVVVLNKSTDRTLEIVQDLISDHPKIRLFEYDFECAATGQGYLEKVKSKPDSSLAKYYNWCLEKTTYSHVCKWDGDMIAIPTIEGIYELIKSNDIVSFDGYDILGRNTTSNEARIFRYDPEHTKYVDWDLYEVLNHEYTKTSCYGEKCYLHMKLIKKEWLHEEWRNMNDTATRPAPPPGSGLNRLEKKPHLIHRISKIIFRQ